MRATTWIATWIEQPFEYLKPNLPYSTPRLQLVRLAGRGFNALRGNLVQKHEEEQLELPIEGL